MESSEARTVQELASKGQQIPEKYIHRDGHDNGAPNAPLMDIPIIDLALLSSPSSSESAKELDKLKSALSTWGCFQAINHGMSPEFLNQVREVTRQFFRLPLEEKQKYLREENGIQGYGNDMVLSDQQKLDWNDRLYLTIHPEDQRKLKFWPQNPEAFRSIIHEYSMRLKWTAEIVLKAMARSLNLEEKCFLEQYGERSKLNARFNLYPKCPRPHLVLGAKPHADAAAITLLLQDEFVKGLQFWKDDRWYKAPIVPEALLINLGDQGQISSNGMFKSPIHRVVTNSEQERSSVAVFYVPDPEKEIEPFEDLIDESRPRLYGKVKNYVDIYLQYYQIGRRAIEAAKIEA